MATKRPRRMSGDDLWLWRMRQRRSGGTVWSQADAATWYGVHERTWRRWENGEVPVPTAVVLRVRGEDE